MGTLDCMELVSRRLQQFIEAHAHRADSTDWDSGWRQSCLGAGAAAALVGGLPGGTACRGDEEKDMGGKACGPPVAKTSLVEGVDRPSGSRRIDGASRQRNEEIFPLPQLRDLSAWSSGGVIRLDAW